ncbi:MAG: UDP-3-O-(3-hydroxymyristoyl)glucosamine N-acyltransferase [Arenimonas sp.]
MSGTHFTLAELAQKFDLKVVGNADTKIIGVAPLASADKNHISFLANSLYRKQLSQTQAAAVILREADSALATVPCLIANDPYVAFAKISALFEIKTQAKPGIHPSAAIDATAQVDSTASIGPFVSIGAHTTVDAHVVIGAGCVVGEHCHIGAQSELVARVTLVTRVKVGQRVLIHPGAVLGAEGFGLAMEAGRWLKVPQLGGVVIGDDCEIGANTTIDRGALGDTVLAEDVRLDNQIQIGHNVQIGAHTAIAGAVAVAGSAKIGRYCLIGGAAGIVGHIEICDKVRINAFSLVTHSITEPGEYTSGTPLQESREWRKNAARFKQLDELARKIKQSTQKED